MESQLKKRSNRFTILLRDDERSRIRAAAQAQYLSESHFARMTLLQRADELLGKNDCPVAPTDAPGGAA
jgi:uncharacterized protein (DUF1778 family)